MQAAARTRCYATRDVGVDKVILVVIIIGGRV